MDSLLVGSSITTGGNLRLNNNRVNNCYAKASQLRGRTWKKYDLLRFQQPILKHPYKGVEEVSTYQEYKNKYVAKAASSGPSFESDPRAFGLKHFFDPVKKIWDTFALFATPYAVVGSTLALISTSFIAVERLSDISPHFFTGLLQAMVSNVLMTIYVCGLNQLCDVEIDKINKPYLPLAAEKFSFKTGANIVAACLILSFGLAGIVGSWPLIWANVSFFLVWTAYSVNVPLLRWKKHPALVAVVFLVSRALTSPIAYFLHMQNFVFKRPVIFPRSLVSSVVIMSFFSIVIAFFKDIPDIEGDQAFGIQSFSARIGKKRAFWISVFFLEMAYAVGIYVGLGNYFLWSKIVTVLGHAALASYLFYRATSVDLNNKASIQAFYMFIWKGSNPGPPACMSPNSPTELPSGDNFPFM